MNLSSDTTRLSYNEFTLHLSVDSVREGNGVWIKTNEVGSTPGIWPVGGIIDLWPGREYVFEVYGHSSHDARFIVTDLTGSLLVWPGPQLPLLPGKTLLKLHTPQSISAVKFGVLFNEPPRNARMFVEKIQYYRIEPEQTHTYLISLGVLFVLLVGYLRLRRLIESSLNWK